MYVNATCSDRRVLLVISAVFCSSICTSTKTSSMESDDILVLHHLEIYLASLIIQYFQYALLLVVHISQI